MDNFLNGLNETYLLDIYKQYLNSPLDVSDEWRLFFDDLDESTETLLEDIQGASWAPRKSNVVGNKNDNISLSDTFFTPEDLQRNRMAQFNPEAFLTQFSSVDHGDRREGVVNSIRAVRMVRSYRVRGHLAANLDPLGLATKRNHPELNYQHYGFTDADLDKQVYLNFMMGIENCTLRELIAFCKRTYCGNLGFEYMHMQIPEEVSWMKERIETNNKYPNFTARGKMAILERLTESEGFEKFLDKKYPSTKRFGLDGAETAIPVIEQILKRSASLDVTTAVLGMSHRGRLNVLAHIMRKSHRAIFSEFQGISSTPEGIQGSGDVKYHMGTSADRDFDGAHIHLSLASNPSHLEAVNTVVLGKVRAHQKAEKNRMNVLGILLHGDAAFAGQGIVAETLLSSQLQGYRTGGTIHLITNNQIGFTTVPNMARSSPYCSDIAKAIGAPILHANADDPEACLVAARMAVDYRQHFGKDVVIDLWCYRRHGHSEIEEPMFTQPLMYKKIKQHPSTRELYAKKLISENIITQEIVDNLEHEFREKLEKDFSEASGYKPNKADWLEGKWHDIHSGIDKKMPITAISKPLIRQIGDALTHTPKNFNLHNKLERFIHTRKQMFETGENIDWATGEALAFGSLLCESTPVRLSGEDCQRGTFSQRHGILIDQNTEEEYIQLDNIRVGQAPIELFNSPLSEYGVLGFEYGYAMSAPDSLVIWEAQFGDFANGAQVIFDQFISSSESKWLRLSGLVVLLPHGYDGQGPEHSSARIERYLQLCAEDNLRVCNITTPANYFHALRFQIHSETRKPLLIMAPKSLLRSRHCVSPLIDFMGERTFMPVLADDREQDLKDPDIKRLIVCSGKIYYELLEALETAQSKDIYLLRLERFYPFPSEELKPYLERFQNAEICWCQEEPENMGGWSFVDRKLEAVMLASNTKCKRPIYIGRSASASPATGIAKLHNREQEKLAQDIQKF